MNRKFIFLLFTLIFFGFSGLYADDLKQSKELLNLQTFNKIDISGAVTVNYFRSTKYYAEIIAEDEILPMISAKVENSSFKVTFEEGAKIYFKLNKKIVINVYAPKISDIDLKGYCKFKIGSDIDTEIMNINVSGASGIQIPLHLKCKYLSMEIDGAGKINADSLDCGTIKATVSGVAKIYLAGKTDRLIKEKNGVAIISTKDLKIGETVGK